MSSPTTPKPISRAARVRCFVMLRYRAHTDAVASGYAFLHNLLAAGTSVSTPAQPHPGILAPPAYLALALSLVADPLYTTQARSTEAQRGSDAALRYLQCIHGTIGGPAFSVVRKAFAFPEERNRRRVPAYRSAASSLSPGGPFDDVERLAGPAANEKSVWHLAEDIWHVVGWAFNCSVLHKKRWDRWKLWLATMLDFLEADWNAAVKESAEAPNPVAVVQASLLWHYIVGAAESTNRGMRRRIVKAILAAGTSESRHSYPEVWRRETVELKRKPPKDGPLSEVNFETGGIGDYESDEEMQEGLEEPDSEDGLSAFVTCNGPTTSNVLGACDRLGGSDAIELRQRFLALVSVKRHATDSMLTMSSLHELQKCCHYNLLLSVISSTTSSRMSGCSPPPYFTSSYQQWLYRAP